MTSVKKYDAIIVGAGHAGTEAALAIARNGYQVLLVTMDIDAVCRMSCNPAIGGLAKGHIVREIDALGGEMALAIDETAIQFRMLNKSKGPAVWAPRAQADKKLYSLYMKSALQKERNIELKQDEAVRLIVKGSKVIGIGTKSGVEYFGQTVVITTGTFMRGLIHIGETNYPGGRRDEPPSLGLSDSLKEYGLEIARFKTGTPSRLKNTSIDYSKCEEQPGDEIPEPFSFRTDPENVLRRKQALCWLTHTNQNTHDIIRKNLHRSPLYAGRILGIGPRYCPSIEDKVVKFADKLRHQIYLEPEGWDSNEIYVNGLSTSLPKDVQEEIIHSILGLENAEIIRYGYAIEYDCLPPTQIKHSLETKKIENLFLAGQVNCTSGYEEAAGQGLMAAYNVIAKFKSREDFVLDRSEAYIGVMIDDLVTCGTNEPYRMFTSRAEFRLLLRQDNADERLMKYGKEFGLIDEKAFNAMLERAKNVSEIINFMRKNKIGNDSLEKITRRPGESLKTLCSNKLDMSHFSDFELRKAEWDIKYEGYNKRQLIEVEKFKKLEKRKIPVEIKYEEILSLGREAKEKLIRIRPESIGQAARIPGITSCDISSILVACKKFQS
jgi:tRNA uridine 5-carboxymethylaminomethyl modification enzyme